VSGGEQDTVPPGFTCNPHHKDLGIIMSMARDAGAAIPVGSVVTQLIGALVAQCHGGSDNGALLRLVEQLSGRDQPARSGSHG
jgi:2-hydroxy-3-oxopropionate reductase